MYQNINILNKIHITNQF